MCGKRLLLWVEAFVQVSARMLPKRAVCGALWDAGQHGAGVENNDEPAAWQMRTRSETRGRLKASARVHENHGAIKYHKEDRSERGG